MSWHEGFIQRLDCKIFSWSSRKAACPLAKLRDDKPNHWWNKHVDIVMMSSQDGSSNLPDSTRTNSLLAKVLTIASSFFVPFVAVSQGFTEISAANRESLNWTSGSVFWIKNRVSLCFYRTQVLTIKKIHKALESKILQKHTPKYLKSLFLKIENIKVLWKTASENNLKKYDFELNP